MRIDRRYSELIQYQTYEERLNYLKLDGSVGFETFGFDRYLNQKFYSSSEWKHIRDLIITRDMGCDLGLPGYEIYGKIFIHHMNPIHKDDIIHGTDLLLNPEYLICVSHDTHNSIHYGNEVSIPTPINRHKNDTCLWK